MPAKSHGLSRSPEYNNWVAMKSRCHNVKNQDYALYGGRGIAVCERWRASFINFLSDMGGRPFPRATIERINTDGNYEPGNCLWATQEQQTRNKRTNLNLTLNGVTKCISVWARELGLHLATLQGRLERGWPIEQVLSSAKMTKWSRKARSKSTV
jgi:hypothetical protein